MQCACDNGVGPAAAVTGGVVRFLQAQNRESVKESPNKDIGVQGGGDAVVRIQLGETNWENLNSGGSHLGRITPLHLPQRLASPYQNHQPGPITSFDCPG